MIGSQPPHQAKGDHSTSASTRMKIHLTLTIGPVPRRRTPVEKAGTSQGVASGKPGLTGTGTRSTGRMVSAEAGKTPHQALPGRWSGTSGKMESGEADWENLSSDSSVHCWPKGLVAMRMVFPRIPPFMGLVERLEPTCSRRAKGPEARESPSWRPLRCAMPRNN